MKETELAELKRMLESGVSEAQILSKFVEAGYEPKEVSDSISAAKRSISEEKEDLSVEEMMARDFGLDQPPGNDKYGAIKGIKKAMSPMQSDYGKGMIKLLSTMLALVVFILIYMFAFGGGW